MKRFDRVALGLLAGLVGVLAVLYIASQLIGMPQPSLTANGARVGALGPVSVTFAGAVDHASAESRLNFTDGTVKVPARLVWQGTVLQVWPTRALEEGKTYTLGLKAGVKAADGRVLRRALTWQVKVRAAQVVYLSPNQGSEIWTAALDGKKTQLTHSNNHVNDFAVSPDGETLAYSVDNTQKGLDLWLAGRDGTNARLLLGCAQDLCETPAFSTDGTRLSYSRRKAGTTPGEAAQLPRVWIFDLVTQETHELTSNPGVSGGLAAWSPDGTWLAFRDDAVEGVRLYHIPNDETLALPADMGSGVEWSPDGKSLFYARAITTDEITYTAMMRYDLASKQSVQLTMDVPIPDDFSSPDISPAGDWLVSGGRSVVGDPARQLILMRPDGSERTAITDDPVQNHANYRWDAGGKRLVFQQIGLDCSCNLPQVVVWVRAGNTFRTLAANAIHPEWMP